MTYNLGTVITRVQRKLDNTSFDSATLIDFANDTQRELFGRYRMGFNERETTNVTTTQGVNTLTGLPTDMSMPFYLRIFSPINYAEKLPYVEYEDVDLYYPNVGLIGQSPPIAWTTFNLVPYIVNNADNVYTMRLKYLKSPVELVTVSDIPEIPVDYSELLVLGMYKRALQHDDSFDQAALVEQEINRLAIDINSRYRRQLGTPHIMRNLNQMGRIRRY